MLRVGSPSAALNASFQGGRSMGGAKAAIYIADDRRAPLLALPYVPSSAHSRFHEERSQTSPEAKNATSEGSCRKACTASMNAEQGDRA
jgi:hypothetical protein